MTKMNHLDFLHAQTKFLSRYSDWITYDLLDCIFSDIKMAEGMTYLELFPEYKSRLNYIQKRFNVNATGCEFYANYRDFFQQYTESNNNVIVNNFFEHPTKEKYEFIFFKPLFSKFMEKRSLLKNIYASLENGGKLLFIEIFLNNNFTKKDIIPSNYHYMCHLNELETEVISSGFTIKKIKNLTETYAENSSGDTLDNRDNQLHTPLLEIEKNLSILRELIEQEKITINSIYCIKD